jgi:hypothetical protein
MIELNYADKKFTVKSGYKLTVNLKAGLLLGLHTTLQYTDLLIHFAIDNQLKIEQACSSQLVKTI